MDKREYVKQKIEIEKDNLARLLPKCLRDKFKEQSFVGGGAIYSLYNNKTVKDYDFFLDNEELAKEIRDYFTSYIINRNEDMENKKFKIGQYRGFKLVVTDNAITIGKYQIITRWVGSPKEVVEEFDFAHNMFYVYKGEIDTFSQWDYLEDNILRFNDKRPRDITGCIIRSRKFIERGFKLTNKEMAKMLLKLNETGFNERELEILEKTGDFES